MTVLSEKRTEDIARELLEVRGWNSARPPKGNILWKNEYREYEFLRKAFAASSKSGSGAGYPDFVVIDHASKRPLIVGETKRSEKEIGLAQSESAHYADALTALGYHPLSVGIAGNAASEIAVIVSKQTDKGIWAPIRYGVDPIQWLPTPDETNTLISDNLLFDLLPRVPSEETLAARGDEINRIFRECDIKDEFRPAVIGAFMLALVYTHGNIRVDPDHVLQDINNACKDAFKRAGKYELSDNILVQEANEKLAARAGEIVYILRLLNLTTLTTSHDYLGQLYETFFRYTGGNTIGQFFTPRHITNFMVDLCAVSDADTVVDPTCGTGGFLISCLYKMMGSRHYTKDQLSQLVAKHLHGFETEPITAALCVANMILRGDGTTGVIKGDCFTDARYPIGEATVVVGNPPFPHARTDAQPDRFVDRALEALNVRGKLAMVVPESFLVKSAKKKWRNSILKRNTLDAVISLPSELFQPYASATTSILMLTKGVPHDASKSTYFCTVKNDGFKLRKNARVPIAGDQLPLAKQTLQSRKSLPEFCTWVPVKDDEWAPGAYIESVSYTSADIQESAGMLLRSQVAFYALNSNKLAHFQDQLDEGVYTPLDYREIEDKSPTDFNEPGTIGELFDVYYGQSELETKKNLSAGDVPIITSAGTNNGCYGFFDISGTAEIISPPFVTVPRTGSIGESFVQTMPCGVTSDCIMLIPKYGADIEDMYIAAAVVRHEKWRFNYGRKITPARLARMPLPIDPVLKQWISSQRVQADRIMRASISVLATDTLQSRFRMLSEQWIEDTALLSNITTKSLHPAYQQIIGLGTPAVHLMLRDFQRGDLYDWFWALRAITGENPLGEEIAGNIDSMAKGWIEWGMKNGFLTVSIASTKPRSPILADQDTK